MALVYFTWCVLHCRVFMFTIMNMCYLTNYATREHENSEFIKTFVPEVVVVVLLLVMMMLMMNDHDHRS